MLFRSIEEAFVKMVCRNGRLTESRMGMKVARKSGLRYTVAMLPVAWRLMRKGRLRPLHVERIADPESLRKALAAIKEVTLAAPTPPARPAPAVTA